MAKERSKERTISGWELAKRAGGMTGGVFGAAAAKLQEPSLEAKNTREPLIIAPGVPLSGGDLFWYKTAQRGSTVKSPLTRFAGSRRSTYETRSGTSQMYSREHRQHGVRSSDLC